VWILSLAFACLLTTVCCTDGLEDQVRLQSNLGELEQWAADWGMHFNPSKCHVVSASKRSHHHQYFCELCGVVLKSVESEKYLGVTLSIDLSWSSHITAICTKANQKLGFIKRNLTGTPRELKRLAMWHLSGQVWNMPALYGILILSRTVMHWRESRGGLLAGSQISTIRVQALPLCYTSFTLNRWRNVDASVVWLSCMKFNMWRCRWISWVWFCVIDLSEDPPLNKDLRYIVVLQLSFRNPLLQELLLSGTHY